MRAAGLAAVLAFALTAGVLAPGSARALPKYARLTGFSCGQCHVNPAGGGPRNAFGLAFAANGRHLTGQTPGRDGFDGERDEGPDMMRGYGWGMMGGGDMMFGGIGMLLFWGVVIVVLVWAGRSLFGTRLEPPFQRPRSGSTAMEILQERFAKGEITKEEYEEAKRTLTE